MANRAAKTSQPEPRHALVLGEGGAAALIARRLTEEGFVPETAGEPLPSISDPDALDKLRALLTRYADQVPGDAPCLHPGVSVWADRPEIATLGEELGLDVICPPARVLALFANKLNLLIEADRLGIPHLVTSFDPISSVREIERLIYQQAMARSTFPFVLKAIKGGGSFGLFVVREPRDLERKIPLWLDQVRRNLGEVAVFSERYIESGRQIVVPFVRYMDGRFKVFPMADASLQCHFRKVVELCPAVGISPEIERTLSQWTRKLADGCGYVGVGSLEFIVDASRAYLIEGSARLNSGFHLWESVAGTSAVAWQLSALEGGAPGQEPVCEPQKHSASGIALRIYAEDSLLHLPQPGVVREVGGHRPRPPSGPVGSAEMDLHVSGGSRIAYSDYGMLGTIWVVAEGRKQALNYARGMLDELWIAGSIQTNERFLAELLAHPWVKEGMFHASFVDEEFLPAVRPESVVLEGFLRACEALAPEPGYRWAVGDQWVKEAASDKRATWAQPPERWMHDDREGLSGRLKLMDGRELRVCAFPLSEHKWQVRVGNWVLPVRRASTGAKVKKPPRLLALVEGRVHAVLYRAGAVVPAHEPLLVLDSLGMLVPHAAPVEVIVKSWSVAAEDIVPAGTPLAELEIVSKT